LEISKEQKRKTPYNQQYSPQEWENLKEQLKEEMMLEMEMGGSMERRYPRRGRVYNRGRYYDPYAYESLERIMHREDNINNYLNDLKYVKDPNVRRILRNIIRDERRNQMQAFNALNNMHQPYGNPGSFRGRMEDFWSLPENRNFLLGAGAGILALMLLPGVKGKVKNLIGNASKGVMGLTDQAQDLMSGIKEDVEDIVAEAQFENFKKQIEDEIANNNNNNSTS